MQPSHIKDSPSRHSLRSVWMKHLDRRGGLWRGAEGDETEAGVVDFLNFIPPPHLVRFASLIGLGTPPVQVFHPDRAKRVSGRGVLCLLLHQHIFSTHNNVITFFLGSPYKPFRMTGLFPCPSSPVPRPWLFQRTYRLLPHPNQSFAFA